MNVSIVIPAYNEEDRLPATLEKIFSWAKSSPLNISEIIVVDDGSTDSTKSIALKYSLNFPEMKIINGSHVGAMNALITGFKASMADYIVSIEADCPVPPYEIDRIFSTPPNFDILTGTRLYKGSTANIGKPLIRRFLSKTNSIIFNILFTLKINDPQIGFKVYKRSSLQKVLPTLALTHDGLKSTELLVRADALGFLVKELPVAYTHNNDSRCVPNTFPIKVAVLAFSALINLWLITSQQYSTGILQKKPTRFSWLPNVLKK
jgi:dolichyl-phosphate beta-glucosyltransferase